jgi:DNA-binding CsgD family transcriptional regulator
VIAWDTLTASLDELDGIRAQLRESRARERTARFYDLVLARMVGANRGEVVAKVIELAEGWVVLHWIHDPKSVGLYSSLLSMRTALCIDNEMMLSLMDASERRVHESRRSVTREDLTETERRVLIELGRGKSNGEIAMALGLSVHTIRNDLSRIYKKFDVQDRLQAGLLARDLDLTMPDRPLESEG